MNQTKFVIRKFKNRNGTRSFRISGFLNGQRVRKNFRTKQEAAAEKSVLEIRAIQEAHGQRTVPTTLREDQIREAEAIFQRLKERPCSLSFYVDFALANYKPPTEQKSLTEAIKAYEDSKKREFEKGDICQAHVDRIQWELKRLIERFPGETVAALTSTSLLSFLEHGRRCLKTYNNRRGIIATFLKYAFVHNWIAENPIVRIPSRKIRRRKGSATTLTVEQARKFMEFLEDHEQGTWVPYYALCLFAGIRPGVPGGEISKLLPDAIRLDAGEIFISAEVSKVREPRKVVIQPNLAAWLRAYPLNRYPIIVGNFKQRRERFNKRFNLTHDVTRH